MRQLSRSENMSRIRSRCTRPEMRLRKALWREGLRYRLKFDLPGRPDLTFVAPKVAIFVDGCFWHGCPLHYSAPSSRQQFWARKLRCNVERDLAVDNRLANMGWHPLHVWQHSLNKMGCLIAAIRLTLRETPKGIYETRHELPQGNVIARPETACRGIDIPWFRCECNSDEVRVLAVSSPGSLRPRAERRPQCAECVCLRCRRVFVRATNFDLNTGVG
jgi:DNA mismatch endonuclease (patch repair protein)